MDGKMMDDFFILIKPKWMNKPNLAAKIVKTESVNNHL